MLRCNDITFCFVVKIKLESVGSGGQIILKSYDGSLCLCLDKHGTVVAKVSFKCLVIRYKAELCRSSVYPMFLTHMGPAG